MEPRVCDYCGAVIEEAGLRHRRRLFCNDECCEAFEDKFLVNGEPDDTELLDDADGDPFDDDDLDEPSDDFDGADAEF